MKPVPVRTVQELETDSYRRLNRLVPGFRRFLSQETNASPLHCALQITNSIFEGVAVFDAALDGRTCELESKRPFTQSTSDRSHSYCSVAWQPGCQER